MEPVEKNVTAAQALEGWREAERFAAVAERDKVAAQTAADAAADAHESAGATAIAAKAALDSAAIAESSAKETAASAQVVVDATSSDLLAASDDVALADKDEKLARDAYRESISRVASS